jgi:hypothetical protein
MHVYLRGILFISRGFSPTQIFLSNSNSIQSLTPLM